MNNNSSSSPTVIEELLVKRKKKTIGPLSEIALFGNREITASTSSAQQRQQQQLLHQSLPLIATLHSLQLYKKDETPLGLNSLRLIDPQNVNTRDTDQQQQQPQTHVGRDHPNSSSISSNTTKTGALFQENVFPSSSPIIATDVSNRSTPFPFPKPHPNNQTSRSATVPPTNDKETEMILFRAKLSITMPNTRSFNDVESEEDENLDEDEEKLLHPNSTPYGSALASALLDLEPDLGEEVDVLVQGFAVGYSYHFDDGESPYIQLYTTHPTSNLSPSPVSSPDYRRYKIETLGEHTFYLSANTLRSHGLLTMMRRMAAEVDTSVHQGRHSRNTGPKPQTIEWYIHKYRSQYPTLSPFDPAEPSSPTSSPLPPSTLRPHISMFYQLFLPVLTTFEFRETVVEEGLLELDALYAFEGRVDRWDHAKLVECVPNGEKGEGGEYRVVWNSCGWDDMEDDMEDEGMEDMEEREATPIPTRSIVDESVSLSTSISVPAPEESRVLTQTTPKRMPTSARIQANGHDVVFIKNEGLEEQKASRLWLAEQEDGTASMDVDSGKMNTPDDEEGIDELDEEEVDELDEDESVGVDLRVSGSADSGRDERNEMQVEQDAVRTAQLADHKERDGRKERNEIEEEDVETMIRQLPWYLFDVPDLLEDALLDRDRERQQQQQVQVQVQEKEERDDPVQFSSQLQDSQGSSQQRQESQSQGWVERKYCPVWKCPEMGCGFQYPREIAVILALSTIPATRGETEGLTAEEYELRRMNALWLLRSNISQHIWKHLKEWEAQGREGEVMDVFEEARPRWASYLRRLSAVSVASLSTVRSV